MIRCQHLQAGYGSVPILFDISLEVADGERVALIGANGAGKTTSLRVLSGVLAVWSGSLELDGQPYEGSNAGRFVRSGISHVPEGRQLFSGMTVEQNLLMGAYARTDSRAEIRRDLHWIYEVFPELAECKSQLGGMLSGGQQQMVAVGRGLMARPKLLMLDELSLGLAPVVVDRLAQTLCRIQDERGISLLIVEQDLYTAFAIADRAYVIENGRTVLAGPTKELIADPRVREAYMGI